MELPCVLGAPEPAAPEDGRTPYAPCLPVIWLLVAAIALVAAPARAATNDLTSAIQRGLFEEEANQNLGAAIQAYQTVASQFDKDRKLAATAIFRLGECYRKQGNTNDAAGQYERILREFSDQPTLVTLSRQNLAALGSAPAAPAAPVLSDAARQEQKRLLEEEIKVVQKQLDVQQTRYQHGIIPSIEVLPVERDLLKLKRQMAALDAGQPISIPATEATASAAAMAESDRLASENQLAELKALPKDKLRIAVQQTCPNPVLTSLMQKLAEVEQNLAALRKDYGPEHAEVQKAMAQLKAVDSQIDAQVEGALKGLEMKRDAAAKIAKGLQAQMSAVSSPGKEATSGIALTPPTSTEADELKRIQALIKDSPDLINAPDRKGETLLQSAAAKGKLAVVKLLLDSGAAVDGLQQPGLTALHYAAGNGHKAIVDLLLSKGAKAGAQTEGGVTPLHLAARKGYEEVAKALLATGAPVKAATKDGDGTDREDLQYQIGSGQTPLHLAANAGYSSLGELLLAKGADANVVDGKGRTPLSYAVDKHYQPVVQLLLAAHANPNAGSSDLPLTEAAYHGDLLALKLLLADGADPNITTNMTDEFKGIYGAPVGSSYNATPLAVAVSRQHADAVAELTRAKADPNGSGPDGTPLIFLALSDPPTLKGLLEAGTDPNRPIPESVSKRNANVYPGMASPYQLYPGMVPTYQPGVTPLYQAVLDGRQPAVELLLAHHADVNWTNSDGWTPLHSAAANGRKAIAELLLKAGAVVDAKYKHRLTPLHWAVKEGKRELTELLLTNKADPNARDDEGQTPLHWAVRFGQQELAELLLANKADPNERDNSGHTPLDLAKSPLSPRPGMPAAMPFSPGPTYPGAPGGPYAAAREPEPKPQAMAELLRQHGAVDNLPQLDRITVRRSAIGASGATFTKGAHDWNQFTLLELFAVQYGFLAASPSEGGGGASYYTSAFYVGHYPRMPFPDLTHLQISRPTANLKSWQDQVVDLTPVLASGDCARDVRLRWGDVVEIPEADHPLNQAWDGFSRTELANLKKCLTRKIEIVVKGQATSITLAPQISHLETTNVEPSITPQTPFWLRPVLLQSKLVLISSDLSRVKVARRDPDTGQQREWVVDCSEASVSAPDFWLQDGDRIEVPEKTYSSAAQAEVPQAAVPGMAPAATPIMPEARAVAPLPTRTMRSPAAQAPQAAVPLNYQWPTRQPGAAPVAAAAETTPPKSAPPSAGSGQQAERPLRQRLANAVQRLPAAQTPEAAEGWYLDVGPVRYSPKTDDAELLNAGYHKARSANTRKAEFWEPRATSALGGRAANAVWTGTDMVVFGGEGMGTSFNDGARYCLAEDTWAMLPSKGAPSSRTGHAMVWTGKEVVVWGGFGGLWGNNTNRNDGARYNPSTDTWKPVSTRNAPSARFDFPAVWMGKEMLVWGGYTDAHSRYQGAHADAYLNTGGCYNPSGDTWKTITTSGAPSRRCFHTLLWTGREMIVWGGGNANKVLNDGYRYNPARDSWTPISADGAPSPRYGHVSVWTGKEMIVWGGSTREAGAPSDYFENGARYNPETDTWKPISTIDAPKGRVSVTAVWTGTEMVLWGGVNDAQDNGGRFVGTGARYNPATDTWTEITTRGAPSPRLTSVVWTGDGFLTFGGYNGTHLNDAWFYSPQRTLYPYAKE